MFGTVTSPSVHAGSRGFAHADRVCSTHLPRRVDRRGSRPKREALAPGGTDRLLSLRAGLAGPCLTNQWPGCHVSGSAPLCIC
jgi:hypothetical protein